MAAAVATWIFAAGYPLAWIVFSAAGVYQLTPLKRACLLRCQSPLAFVPVHFEHDIKKRRTKVSVARLLETITEPLKNLATGKPFAIRVQLPDGMEYKLAETAVARTLKGTGQIACEHASVVEGFRAQRAIGYDAVEVAPYTFGHPVFPRALAEAPAARTEGLHVHRPGSYRRWLGAHVQRQEPEGAHRPSQELRH